MCSRNPEIKGSCISFCNSLSRVSFIFLFLIMIGVCLFLSYNISFVYSDTSRIKTASIGCLDSCSCRESYIRRILCKLSRNIISDFCSGWYVELSFLSSLKHPRVLRTKKASSRKKCLYTCHVDRLFSWNHKTSIVHTPKNTILFKKI